MQKLRSLRFELVSYAIYLLYLAHASFSLLHLTKVYTGKKYESGEDVIGVRNKWFDQLAEIAYRDGIRAGGPSA